MNFISYAQNREDVVLWRALKNVQNGFYIDIGAAWPVLDSVTKSFYLSGWNGINIEPNPDLYSLLQKDRPHDINLQIAVSKTNGEIDFNLFPETGLSTLNKEIAKQHIENNFHCVPLRIITRSLSDIWKNYVPKGRDVHFLKIDIEGSEYDALQSNDWKINRPWVVVVEATVPLSQNESHLEWESILAEAAYIFVYADGLNRFYVDSDHSELLIHFKYPPNVHDAYILAAEVKAEDDKRQAESRAAIAEARAVAAEESQRVAEALAGALSDELFVMVSSRSWRVTKPLRQIVFHSRRLRFFAKFTVRRIFHMQPRVLMVCMLKSVKSSIERKPATRKIFLRILNKFPRIMLRISRALGVRTETTTSDRMESDTYSSQRIKRMEKIVSCVVDGLQNHK